MKLILCVEDERRVLENNRKALIDSGYAVITAENLAEARDRLISYTPDAIVLDIMLPDGLGLDLLKELREAGSKIPVIMLTAWDKSSDVKRGLDAGANDYLSKPFEYEELLARISAMFRNVEQVPETLTMGRLSLKLTPLVAYLDGENMLLTQKEFSLLLLFVKNEGRVISAEYLYEQVWEQPMNEDNQAVKTAVARLRNKLEDSGIIINYDKRKGGYCLKKER